MLNLSGIDLEIRNAGPNVWMVCDAQTGEIHLETDAYEVAEMFILTGGGLTIKYYDFDATWRVLNDHTGEIYHESDSREAATEFIREWGVL